MRTESRFIEHTLETGGIASVATTLAVALLGKGEIDRAAAPLNAISHILWGDDAAQHDEFSAQYTLSGVALNAAAITTWAAIYEAMFGEQVDRGDAAGALLGGAIVSAIAYVTDYYLVPKRLTPGFEKRLSDQSLFAIYGVLAASLGLGRMCLGNRTNSRTARRN